MRVCKQCGLSIGDRATFCQVCGAIVEPPDAADAAPPGADPQRPGTPAECEAEARRCQGTDPARAAALYRQAIVDHLDSSDDPLGDKAMRRDLQRLFDRLSTLLKREGLNGEALEEIDAAASLGLVDDEGTGTKAQRTALAKRRDALHRTLSKATRSQEEEERSTRR